MSLVQNPPNQHAAMIMSAVAAHAEATGALILAEGIETNEHLSRRGHSGPSSARAGYPDVRLRRTPSRRRRCGSADASPSVGAVRDAI